MSYKLQHVKWRPQYHALTIWECIGELSEEQRGYDGDMELKPPRAPAASVNGWYHEAVRVANNAIVKMIREDSP